MLETAVLDLGTLYSSALEELPGLLQDPNPDVRLKAVRLIHDMVSANQDRQQAELLGELEDRIYQLADARHAGLPAGVQEVTVEALDEPITNAPANGDEVAVA